MWNTSWLIILCKVQNLKIWKKTYNCWGMSSSNKLDLRLNLNNDDTLSPISMLPSFHRIYFLQDQDLPVVCNSSREENCPSRWFLFFPMTTTVVTKKIALNWEVFQICCCLQHPTNLKIANSPNEEEVPLTSSCFSKQESVWCLACQ